MKKSDIELKFSTFGESCDGDDFKASPQPLPSPRQVKKDTARIQNTGDMM